MDNNYPKIKEYECEVKITKKRINEYTENQFKNIDIIFKITFRKQFPLSIKN